MRDIRRSAKRLNTHIDIVSRSSYYGNMCKNISAKDYNKCKNSIQSSIRRSFARSEHYKGFLKLHRVEWVSGNRKRVSYRCNKCSELNSGKDINVDHITPLGKLTYRDIRDAEHFYKLVYCDYSNLQILCKPCHKEKTKWENKNPHFDNACF